ncbi:MAG: hypothetical protein K0R03_1807 [Moraxellaceae bacterium]|jgi:glycosyltransferase involved in cell wall biosynthesis|nr:hypothetical protein [Moraxellaceae bacterium]
MSRPRLCFVTAVPMTVTSFLNDHIRRLAQDYDVYVITDFSAGTAGVSPLAKHLHVPIPRDISLLRDLRALLQLWRVFREHRFDVVQSVTPKAGLLGMLAGLLAGVPHRVHWFTGQVWVTRSGPMRALLKSADRLVATVATRLLADSPSQRDFLVAEKVAAPARIDVIGDGSICGVDAQRFRPDAEARAMVRARHGIPASAPVVLFLGRLNVDKGLRELAEAINRVSSRHPDVQWLLVGPDEGGMEAHIRTACAEWLPRLHFQGFTREPQQYMAAADIFCLPSYREGFGSSVLEAAAAGIPAVATRIYGLTDAVAEGSTGLLVPPRDAGALAVALLRLLQDEPARAAMGNAARMRAIEKFSSARIVEGLAAYYFRITGSGASS